MNFKDYLPWNSGKKRGTAAGYDEANPFGLLQRQMNSLFDDFFSGFSSDSSGKNFTPRVDVSEDNENIYVAAELPGLTDKDVEVTLTNDTLTIRGEKKEEREEREGKSHYFVERSYGFFQRSVPLSCEVVEDKVDAVFKNGLLRITLQKSPSARAQSKKITIRQQA